MKIALIYNPDAGGGQVEPDDLQPLFASAGHELLAVSTQDQHWQALLSEGVDRVVIAGGDGTVREAVPFLAECSLPFHILPLGTANNIAISLRQFKPIKCLISGFNLARPRALDLGRVSGSSLRSQFIEAIGVGLLVELMRLPLVSKANQRLSIEATAEEKIAEAWNNLAGLASDYPGVDCELFIDDVPVSGRFLLVEILNIKCIGPRLPLAPDADPGDGFLNVVCVPTKERHAFQKSLEQLRQDGQAFFPFRTKRCQRVELRTLNSTIHVDDQISEEVEMPLHVHLDRAVLNFYHVETGN